MEICLISPESLEFVDKKTRIMGVRWLVTSTVLRLLNKEPQCSICNQTYFKVERIAPDKVRLTCENCEEQHLLLVKSKGSKKSSLKFEIEASCHTK